jgi:hypothetical protein
MKWKKRKKQLILLRLKHGKDRSLARPFPDLSIEPKDIAPLSNRIDKAPKWKKA